MDAVCVVSIHDRSLTAGYLAFDLREMLAALGDKVSQWSWWVVELDALGGAEVQSFCDAVESQSGNGVWVSADELLALSLKIEQTIDGKFFAFKSDVVSSELTSQDLNWGHFPDNKMQLGILAVDSSYFEILAKHDWVVAALRSKFSDVRLQSPDFYFREKGADLM